MINDIIGIQFKKGFIMNIIQLHKEKLSPYKKKKSVQITVPSGWWNSNYSFEYDKSKGPLQFGVKKNKSRKLPGTPGWNANSGDYRVKDSKIDARDYVYYRDLKIKIMKYSLYPFVVVTILLIIKVSSVLSSI